MAHSSRRHLLWIVPLAVLLVVLAAAGATYALFDPNAYKDRIATAVERQTGRKLVIGGNLRLTLNPVPALEASDVSFANAPGGSRPEMVTARRVQAEIAWLPLLHRQVVITRLTLTNPDFLLEREADGTGNWMMSQQAPNRAPQSPSLAEPPSQPRAPSVVVQGLRLVDGMLTWRGSRTVVLAVAQADLDEATPDSPITAAATASHEGTKFQLTGRFGSLSRLRDTAATDKWPVTLSATAAGASLAIDGSFTRPRSLDGYDLAIKATAPDLGLITNLTPWANLPGLRDLRLTAHIAAGKPLPVVTELVLHAGASDLGATLPDVKLANVDIAIPGPDQPMHAALAGSYGGAPLQLAAVGGTPASLLPGGPETPFPLDLSAEIAGAKLHVKGTMARPREQAGLQAALSAEIPDLTAFAALARRPLPALRDLSLSGEIGDRDGVRDGITLQNLRLSLPQGDLAGDLAIGFGDHPTVQGKLAGKRFDLDAIRATWPAPEAGASSPLVAKPPTAPAGSSRFLIPDTPFVFTALHRGDADLRLDLGEFVIGAVAYRAVAGHLVLKNGHLVVDPAAATLPAGPAAGRLEIDASRSPAAVALVLHSPGLAFKPLLTELAVPDDVTGVLQVETDLHGTGDTPHDVAATVDGTLGLSMVGGTVDDRLLQATFGQLLRTVKLPGDVGGNGHADVRCFALSLAAEHGAAAVRALLIDVSRLRVTGSGTIDLGRETLALRLRPFVKIAGSGLVVPLHVGGTFRKPQPSVDPAGAPEAAAATAVELANKGAMISGVTSALAAAGERLLGEADTGDCGPALALARDGKSGPEPAPPKQEKAVPVVNDLLKRLFK